MPWISIRKSSVDPNGVGTRTERQFNKNDLIGVLLVSKCDKYMAKSYDESVKELNQYFVDCLGEKIEHKIGLGMQHTNDHIFFR